MGANSLWATVLLADHMRAQAWRSMQMRIDAFDMRALIVLFNTALDTEVEGRDSKIYVHVYICLTVYM